MTISQGDRPAVLLLHGLCANPLELAPVAKALREVGYVVEVPELPGYGVSARAGGECNARDECNAWDDRNACSQHADRCDSRHAESCRASAIAARCIAGMPYAVAGGLAVHCCLRPVPPDDGYRSGDRIVSWLHRPR